MIYTRATQGNLTSVRTSKSIQIKTQMWFLPHQVQLDYLDLTRGVYSISMCSVAQYKYQTIPMDLRVGLACHGCKEYYPQSRNGGGIIPSMKELSLWTFGWDGSIVTIRNITHRPGMVGWLFPQWKKVDKGRIGTLFPRRGGANHSSTKLSLWTFGWDRA